MSNSTQLDVLGLFGVLPAYVGAASDGRPAGCWSWLLRESSLEDPGILYQHPSLALERALDVKPAHVERLITDIGRWAPWDPIPPLCG